MMMAARILALGFAMLAVGPAQGKHCTGWSSDKNYYPSVNNSFPEKTVYLDAEIKTGNIIWPNAELDNDFGLDDDYGCVTRPLGSLVPHPQSWNKGFWSDADSLRRNDTIPESAEYWCNKNGTVLSFREYNGTTCGAQWLMREGNYSVPFTRGALTYDCSCYKKDVFVESRQYNSSKYDNNEKRAENNYNKRSKCKGDHDQTLTMSGSCFGYFDNASWSSAVSPLRSVRMTCDGDSSSVEYLEYQGTLDCDQNKAKMVLNETYDVDTCYHVRNKTLSFSCGRARGGGKRRVKKKEDLSISLNDVLFLAIAFFYLVFVVTVCALLYCYISGMICAPKVKDDTEGDSAEQKLLDDLYGTGGAKEAEVTVAVAETAVAAAEEAEVVVEGGLEVEREDAAVEEEEAAAAVEEAGVGEGLGEDDAAAGGGADDGTMSNSNGPVFEGEAANGEVADSNAAGDEGGGEWPGGEEEGGDADGHGEEEEWHGEEEDGAVGVSPDSEVF